MTNLTQETLFSPQTQPENERLALLKQHFPNCFDKHGAFLPDKMAEILHSDGISTQKEGYSLNWLGKSYARVLKDTPPETLLSEDVAHNQQPENANSENLLIKGDNLEVLKHLKHAYKNQIKMIYIDPPYNTGSDGFVYQDDRQFTPEQLAQLGGMSLDEAARVLEFTAKKSNSHSAWLTFMYPRLYVARELLREDGVIFISIDDNEQAQLKILCDEVFGEGNFVTNLIWQKKYRPQNDAANFSEEHDFILCIAKNKKQKKSDFGWARNLLARTDEQTSGYKNPDNDPRGDWTSSGLMIEGTTKNCIYTITGPTGIDFFPTSGKRWSVSKDTFELLNAENRIWYGVNGDASPRVKRYLSEVQQGIVPSTIMLFSDVGHTGEGKKDLMEFFTDEVFSYPKPVRLITRLLLIATNPTDLILDFFAGSGTTAHAVMQLNAEDGGNRRFILAQLPEKTDKQSEAYKAGYKTIFDITQARIEKAAAKIRAENPDYTGDLGFKIFKTIPNFQAALTDDFNPQQADLPDTKDAVLSDEQLHTLLTTWRVYDGFRLPEKVQAVDLAGYAAYLCGKHVYLLARGFASAHVKALIDRLDNDADFAPERIVLFGANMDSAMQKELAQAVKTYANKKGLDNLSVLARY